MGRNREQRRKKREGRRRRGPYVYAAKKTEHEQKTERGRGGRFVHAKSEKVRPRFMPPDPSGVSAHNNVLPEADEAVSRKRCHRTPAMKHTWRKDFIFRHPAGRTQDMQLWMKTAWNERFQFVCEVGRPRTSCHTCEQERQQLHSSIGDEQRWLSPFSWFVAKRGTHISVFQLVFLCRLLLDQMYQVTRSLMSDGEMHRRDKGTNRNMRDGVNT